MLTERRACTLCRKRKIRCNREIPCNNCVRTKKESCTYDSQLPPPLPLGKLGEPKTGRGHGSNVDQRAYPEGLSKNLSTPRPSVATTDIRDTSATASILVGSGNDTLRASNVANLDVGALQIRIKHLEEQLSKATQSTTPPKSTSRQGTAINATYLSNIQHRHESRLFGSTHIISRGVMHKNRLYGQSHWGNGIVHVVGRPTSSQPGLRLTKS